MEVTGRAITPRGKALEGRAEVGLVKMKKTRKVCIRLPGKGNSWRKAGLLK